MKPQVLAREFVADFERALLGPDGEALVRALQRVALRQAPAAEDAVSLALAERSGWIVEGRATARGQIVIDAVREYAFWVQRERLVVPRDAHEALRRLTRLEGRTILEVGAGFGVNGLAALRDGARSFTGLDLELGYLQLSEAFTKRERLPRLRLACGASEALPFRDESFDLVLCSAVLQYVRPQETLREIARVMQPGGALVLVAGTMAQNLLTHLDRGAAMLRPRALVGLARSLANGFFLQTLGEKPFDARRSSTTSSAAQTSRRHVERCLGSARLEVLEVKTVSRYDTLYHARKPM